MKTFTLTFALFLSVLICEAQICVKKDSTGNFTYAEKPYFCDSITGKYLITKKGEKLPVYITTSGSLYIIPSGQKYRRLYLNVQ